MRHRFILIVGLCSALITIACTANSSLFDKDVIQDHRNKSSLSVDMSDELFLQNFPTTFQSFTNLFQYDPEGKSGVHYLEANGLIDHFYSIRPISQIIPTMLSIAQNGSYAEDAVAYFQDGARKMLLSTNVAQFCSIAQGYSSKQLEGFFWFLIDRRNPFILPLDNMKNHCNSKIMQLANETMMSYKNAHPKKRWTSGL